MSSVISTTQTDLGLRSRTFSQKINKLPTFSEITRLSGKHCVYLVKLVQLLNFNYPLHS